MADSSRNILARTMEEAPDIFREKLNEEECIVYLKLTQETIQAYREIFDIFDETGDGTISNDEIGKVMQGLGENPSPEQIEALIKEIDYNSDGEVDFEEFVCLMVKTLNEADKAEEEIVTVFKRFDKNGDGEIDAQDLQAVFNELGYECDQEEARDMIHFFDRDEDNSINFAEFVQLMMYDTMDQTLFDQIGERPN